MTRISPRRWPPRPKGIFLWAFEGLQRLVRNGFKFTESDRARQNRELVNAGQQ